MEINNIGLFGKFNDDGVSGHVNHIRALLENRGCNVYLGETTSRSISGTRIDQIDTPLDELLDIAVVLGGDGTMLSAARRLARYAIPTVGVNLGRLGFLTDIALEDFEYNFDKLLTDEYYVENRIMLQTSVIQNQQVVFSGLSLNDTVISKGNTGRLIEFDISVNQQFVSHTRSDGMIIATPTGSTAYSLSAGGPIIEPQLEVLSMSPICPHTMSNRPIILSAKDTLEITNVDAHHTPVNVSTDGIICYELTGNEVVKISKADVSLQLLRIKNHNHFETLRNKLGWSS